MQSGRARRASEAAPTRTGSTWKPGGVPRRTGLGEGRGRALSLGFWNGWRRAARKEWAELHKRQEDMRQRLDRESRTVLGRLRIWRLDRSLRELAGAIRGREDLVEGWREDLDRHHRDERAELAKAHGERAREIERGWGKFYRNRVVDAERRAWAVRRRRRSAKRRGAGARPDHHPHSIRPPRPRGPERGGEGSSDNA